MSAPRRAALALIALAPFGAARAQETRLRLTESATVRRAPEEAFATLRLEARAGTAAAAQASVNRGMAAALEAASRVAGLRATTGRYAAHRVEDPRGWLAVQSLTLRGGDPAALADLAGSLQAQGFALEGIGARLSEAAQREAKEEATRQALRLIRARAELVAQELGLALSHLAEVAVDAPLDEVRPAPMMTAAAMRGGPPPVAAPEDVAVTVRVAAQAILAPR